MNFATDHARCIAAARKATQNRRTDYPRYALGWSRKDAMYALDCAASHRRALRREKAWVRDMERRAAA